jgi:hypothetical protein
MDTVRELKVTFISAAAEGVRERREGGGLLRRPAARGYLHTKSK